MQIIQVVSALCRLKALNVRFHPGCLMVKMTYVPKRMIMET